MTEVAYTALLLGWSFVCFLFGRAYQIGEEIKKERHKQ